MAPHSSILAWRIPGTGEPGGLLSMGLHRVGHDCSDLAIAAPPPGDLGERKPSSQASTRGSSWPSGQGPRLQEMVS